MKDVLTKIGRFIAGEDALGWLSIFLEDAARYNEQEGQFKVAELARSASDALYEAMVRSDDHDN